MPFVNMSVHYTWKKAVCMFELWQRPVVNVPATNWDRSQIVLHTMLPNLIVVLALTDCLVLAGIAGVSRVQVLLRPPVIEKKLHRSVVIVIPEISRNRNCSRLLYS
jgi:hypothetical protein